MIGALSSNLFRMPSAGRFLDDLIDDIRRGRSVLVLLPHGVEPDLMWGAIVGVLQGRREVNVRYHEIYVPEMPRDLAPHLALAQALQVDWPSQDTPRTVANLIDIGGVPDLLLLRDLGKLDEADQGQWLTLIDRWERASQSMVNSGGDPKRLVIIDKFSDLKREIPASSNIMAVRWWWSIPSALEMRMLYRLASSHEGKTAKSRWREHVLPALVGNDLELAEYLWAEEYLGGDGLPGLLSSFVERRDWDPVRLKDWGADEFPEAIGRYRSYKSESPPPELRVLWGHGAISHSPEYGLELHPGVHKLLDQEGQIKHRIWRGEVELLSPVLDNLRIEICNYLTQTYGTDWPVKWDLPLSREEEREAREDPLSTQWPHIVHLLGGFRWKERETRLREQAQLARDIRNKIYHYNPVGFRDFELLDKMMESR